MKSKTGRCAVLFDMDGVLVDSYEAHYRAWEESCEARGFPLTREHFAELFGQSFQSFADALSTRALTAAEVQAWYEEKEGRYRDIIERNFPEIDGAGDLIRNLHEAGFVIGVASAGPRANVECLLRHLTHAERIRFTVSADDVTHTKPHPEPYLKCAEGLGVPPSQCVVVEDSVHGLEAGRAAGMATVGLVGTATAEELAKAADRVVRSLRELDADSLRGL